MDCNGTIVRDADLGWVCDSSAYNLGYSQGSDFKGGSIQNASQIYFKGYSEGYSEGILQGHNKGYTDGYTNGYNYAVDSKDKTINIIGLLCVLEAILFLVVYLSFSPKKEG